MTIISNGSVVTYPIVLKQSDTKTSNLKILTILFIIFINDIFSEPKFAKAQLFADDLKLYSIIKSLNDCFSFNQDLAKLDVWCKANGMEMNAKKCNVISFYRNKSYVYNYYLSPSDTEPLNRVTSIRDLGVIMDSRLQFAEQVNKVITKANKQLGFIIRYSKIFKDKKTLRLLYMSLIRPIITYNSVVWYPQHKEIFDRLERIQHKFFRFASFLLGIHRDRFDHNYEIIANHLKIPTIKSVFDVNDLSFIYRLFNNYIDCEELCTYLKKPKQQYYTRNPNIFDLPNLQRNYLQNSPLYRPQALANTHRSHLSFHGLLPHTFSKEVKKVMYEYK